MTGPKRNFWQWLDEAPLEWLANYGAAHPFRALALCFVATILIGFWRGV